MTLATRLIALVALSAPSMLADMIFLVQVDTSSLGPTATGFLDLQFNPAGVPSPAGTANVTDFAGVSFTVDDGTASALGDISGSLTPGPLVFGNGTVFNDYFVPFQITAAGSGFSFLVGISGDILSPDPANLNGTDFAVLLFGDDGFTPLLTADGQSARIAVSPAGDVDAQGFGPTAVMEVPEPSMAIPLLAALAYTVRRIKANALKVRRAQRG